MAAREKVPAALLRTADISIRITRTNARAMLASLCHFVRKAGAAGLLAVLDVRQLSRHTVVEGALRYSPAAVMDSYEVLREAVDRGARTRSGGRIGDGPVTRAIGVAWRGESHPRVVGGVPLATR